VRKGGMKERKEITSSYFERDDSGKLAKVAKNIM
jgi:hypothetical protein